ncbi:MAG: DUF1810 domain-containing protein [Pseudomonadota bacterium]
MEEDEAELFIEAQDRVWSDVIAELSAGKKTTHWMWFVFPQLAELGSSPNSQLFGLHDVDEARGYLAHPVLGPRLLEATRLVLQHGDRTPTEIMGEVDAKKLRSSMTLFAMVGGANPAFQAVIDTFYAGERCPLTLKATA